MAWHLGDSCDRDGPREGSARTHIQGNHARTAVAGCTDCCRRLGIVYGLLVVFLSAQVWNDSQRAGAEVLREASALRAVVLLAASYPEDSRAALRNLVRRQIRHAAEEEWPAIAPIALRVTLQGEGHAVAQREIVAALENAFDARRQRIIISRSGINWVKWTGLIAQAIVTLLAIAMVHSDNRAAAMAMGLFATAVAISIVLIAAHARPFSGEISVGPAVLQEVLPEQEQLPAAGSGK